MYAETWSLKPWEYLFKAHILARGWDYYENGAVSFLERTGTGYKVTVEGSYDYEVEVEIYDNEVVEMFCDCPYAEDGNYCKHMAAVLYEIEELYDRLLKKIIKYPDERKIADQIAKEWKVIYPRRPAMMDELRKADFRIIYVLFYV